MPGVVAPFDGEDDAVVARGEVVQDIDGDERLPLGFNTTKRRI